MIVRQDHRSSANAQAVPFPQQLSKMDLARLKAYRDSLDFYQGSQWLEPQRRRERRLTFNYAKTLIEMLAPGLVRFPARLPRTARRCPAR
jgi:hypothetical protein